MKLKVLILFLLLCRCCYAQDVFYLDKDFTLSEIPSLGSKEHNMLNLCGFSFEVKIINGKLEIGRYNSKERKYTLEFDVPNGKLIGVDRGQYGGRLFFEHFEYLSYNHYYFLWKYFSYILLSK